MGAATRTSPSFSATVDVETPELVVLSYTIAGVGSRSLAALIDYLICFGGFLAVMILIAWLTPDSAADGPPTGTTSDAWAFAIVILMQFFILWGYYVLMEALADGQTLGKRALRLRVVRDGGYSITFAESAVRNLLRIVDMQPFLFYAVGLVSMIFSRYGKRLGDYAAGTIVVREALTRTGGEAPRQPAVTATATAERRLHTSLTDEEFTLLGRFLERRTSLDRERRVALGEQLVQRFAAALAGTEGATEKRLFALFALEQDARAQGVAAKKALGAAREKHAIIAAGSPRWNRFASRLAEAQRRGLTALGEEGVREFVAEYRDLSSDLARLRTASRGERNEEVFYLSRLVAGAHNLLYRRRSFGLREIVRFLGSEVPREIRASWLPIGIAAVLLFGPMAIAYTAVVRRPEVAATFVPDHMIERAELGVERARTRKGYIPDPEVFRPVMASSIIANNVQVTFAAFGGGMLLGLPTAVLLVVNGVSFGGVHGLYVSKGIGGLLVSFVAPHGVLELTAICIAGGAGFLLGAALLVPGLRTRRRALVENGRRAIRLIAGSTLLLVVAGSIEGFISPIPSWSLNEKLAVSGATAVLLVLYLMGGRAPRARRVTEETREDEGDSILALGAQSAPRDLISR